MIGKMGLVIAAVAVVMIGGGLTLVSGGAGASSGKKQLVGDDFGELRRQALDMFPRGKPVSEVKDGLKALGFLCAPVHRLMANINAPSVECDSAGRGYPDASRMEVTVMARNGTLSDIAIGNGLDALEANARTPDPNPKGRTDAAGTR